MIQTMKKPAANPIITGWSVCTKWAKWPQKLTPEGREKKLTQDSVWNQPTLDTWKPVTVGAQIKRTQNVKIPDNSTSVVYSKVKQ